MKTLIRVLILTVVMFIWNMVSWMVLPFHSDNLKNLPAGVIEKGFNEAGMESGVYHYPGVPNEHQDISQIKALLEDGPRITLMVYQEGSFELFDPMTFVTSLFLNLMVCSILVLILQKLPTTSTSTIIGTCAVLGLLVSISSDFAQMNWYKFPLSYTLANAMDHIVGFALVGLTYGLLSRKDSIQVD